VRKTSAKILAYRTIIPPADIHLLKLKNQKDWLSLFISGNKPGNIPTVLFKKYKSDGWFSYVGRQGNLKVVV